MEIFNNQTRSGYEEIVSYGPKWWTEFKEMDAVYRYEGWQLDLMAAFMERVINNQFPSFADEDSLKYYEKAFRIEPDENASIEERQREAAVYYSGGGKLSKTTIKQLIRNYTGCDCDVWWDDVIFNIRIYMVDEKSFSNKKVLNILTRRFPAHIPLNIREVLSEFHVPIPKDEFTTKYSFEFNWWDGNRMLDGEFALDGTNNLDQERYPTWDIKVIKKND